MKDDLWVARYGAELIMNRSWRGSRHWTEQEDMEERQQDLEALFRKRFGKERGEVLIKEIFNQLI